MKSVYLSAILTTVLLGLSACAPQMEGAGAMSATGEMTGGMTGGATSENPNLLRNSSFNGDDAWEAYFLEAAAGESRFAYGELCLDIESPGNDVWNTQALQGGLSLEPGESYTLSFNAYANKPVEVRAAMEENGNDYTLLGGQMFALTEERTDYSFSAEIPEEVDEGRISVSTGGEFVSATPVRICLDDVELRVSN